MAGNQDDIDVVTNSDQYLIGQLHFGQKKQKASPFNNEEQEPTPSTINWGLVRDAPVEEQDHQAPRGRRLQQRGSHGL